MLPVFPEADAQPLVTMPTPPTLEEVDTAQTLLTMQENQAQSSQVSEIPQSICNLDLQEPSVTTHVQPTELVLKNPPTATLEPQELHFNDAMDKMVEHIDVSFMEPGSWLKFRDCMDLIAGRVTELVETLNLSNLATMDWDKILSCTVELLCIKYTPTLKLPTLQITQDLVSLGQLLHQVKIKAKQTKISQMTKKCKY